MRNLYRNLFASVLLAGAIPSVSQAATLADAIGDTPVYGYFVDMASGKLVWQKLSAEGNPSEIWEAPANNWTYIMTDGWIRNNSLCGVATVTSTNNIITAVCYESLNPVDGSVIKQQPYSPYDNIYRFSSAVYSPADDIIYGYGMNPNASYYPAWKTAPGNGDLNQVEYIKTLEDPFNWCPALCINEENEDIFGVTFRNKFMKIEKDGSQTLLFDLNVNGKGSNTGLAYIPSTGKFLWSAHLSDGTSALYMIDPEAKTADLINNLEGNSYYAFFTVGDAAACIGVPGAPQVNEPQFVDGSLSGSVEIKIPSQTLTSDKMEGEIAWTAFVDGVKYSEGMAAPGETVKVEFSDLSQGSHTFSFQTEYKGKVGPEASVSAYIGNDTPVAVDYVDLALEGSILTALWPSVDFGVNDGWLDMSKLEYEVYLNDKLMTVTSDTEWAYEIDTDQSYSAYKVGVVATCNGLNSLIRQSNTVYAGTPINLDYTIQPTAEEAALMTYITDAYGTRWKFDASLDPAAFTSGYYGDGPVDDWLITPPLNFAQNATYEVSFKADAYRDYWGPFYEVGEQEYFDVWFGDAPTADGMTQQLLEKTKVEDEEVTYTIEFPVAEPGTYYIGFHGQSAANNPGITLRDIKISCKTSVGVAEVSKTHLSVKAEHGRISISGINGSSADIYTLSGVKVTSLNGDATVEVAEGIYIIKAGDISRKITVKP